MQRFLEDFRTWIFEPPFFPTVTFMSNLLQVDRSLLPNQAQVIDFSQNLHTATTFMEKVSSLSRPGPWKKSLNFIFPTKYGIPKSSSLLTPNCNPTCNMKYFVDILVLTIG